MSARHSSTVSISPASTAARSSSRERGGAMGAHATGAKVSPANLSLDPPILAAPRRRGSPPDADRPRSEGAHPEDARPIDPGGAHDAEASTMIGGFRLNGV